VQAHQAPARTLRRSLSHRLITDGYSEARCHGLERRNELGGLH
jgi:hypothetical protein